VGTHQSVAVRPSPIIAAFGRPENGSGATCGAHLTLLASAPTTALHRNGQGRVACKRCQVTGCSRRTRTGFRAQGFSIGLLGGVAEAFGLPALPQTPSSLSRSQPLSQCASGGVAESGDDGLHLSVHLWVGYSGRCSKHPLHLVALSAAIAPSSCWQSPSHER